ncbi:hypothetical protein Fmac_022071 [Flemingia macrophylla]|uniref:Uncharacterized protein n=1 Tax=Flemingia macrophylla TaxID=520843 RepID=A0ABD1LYR3_9FABA
MLWFVCMAKVLKFSSIENKKFEPLSACQSMVRVRVFLPDSPLLKTLRLKELTDDIKSQRMKQNSDKGQKKSNQKDFVGSDLGGSHVKEPGMMQRL